MKKLILLIVICGSIIQLFGQEIDFFTLYSGSNYNKFKSNIGYGIGYNHFGKSKNKLGFIFQHSFCNSNYSHIFNSLSDGISTYIQKIEPNNQQIAIKINYAFKIVNNPKSSLFIGPEIGINYFLINEQVRQMESEYVNAKNYQSKYSENNKISFGFLLDFELKEVIHKRISTYLSLRPEFISFEKFGIVGSYDPYFIRYLSVNLGIRYNLIKKQQKTPKLN